MERGPKKSPWYTEQRNKSVLRIREILVRSFLNLFAYYFLKLQLHHFSKIKSRKKKSQHSRN